ncbi:hypothetical protein HRI_002392100 [Hibiscus trionum]|uniref:Uncharacterized protein n=1 Tax=Hibiscus trionum TaxID=183268 RepID=A0A9W7M470_HIBTR|nr:hypothetical protein HRI_002392100 [Hibiscus trionum]
MNTKWRQWKNELKSQIFDENQNVEQIVENCKDPRVILNQLKTLVEYWLSSKAMEQSATNRSNRSKLSEPHCTGTRSFPRIVEDLTEESNGISPTRADVYVRSCTRKYGSIVNSRAAVVVERIQEKRNESSSSENLSQTSWSNDVFAQVKGPERRGRVRCVGAIHTRSSQESGPSQSVQNTEEVEGLKSKVAKLEKLLKLAFYPTFNNNVQIYMCPIWMLCFVWLIQRQHLMLVVLQHQSIVSVHPCLQQINKIQVEMMLVDNRG